jgi:hypothetical protein
MEAPAAAGVDPIAVAGGSSAQYYGPRWPATLPAFFHALCVRFEICIVASEWRVAGLRPGARLRLNRASQTVDIKE